MDSPTIVTIIQVAGEARAAVRGTRREPSSRRNRGSPQNLRWHSKRTMPVGILSNARKADVGLSGSSDLRGELGVRGVRWFWGGGSSIIGVVNHFRGLGGPLWWLIVGGCAGFWRELEVDVVGAEETPGVRLVGRPRCGGWGWSVE